jgi:UDP-N-acetylmuramoylalanine--D-glutamate ligase
VRYVSSSIDTTPERTKATLSGLDSRVRIILGGRGKGLSLEPLRNVLKKYADKIAVYGEVGREITEFIDSDDELKKIPHAAFKVFDEAIDYATDGVKVGDTVLLSPAATSYGEFADYKERGAHFKKRIKSIGNL